MKKLLVALALLSIIACKKETKKEKAPISIIAEQKYCFECELTTTSIIKNVSQPLIQEMKEIHCNWLESQAKEYELKNTYDTINSTVTAKYNCKCVKQ